MPLKPTKAELQALLLSYKSMTPVQSQELTPSHNGMVNPEDTGTPHQPIPPMGAFASGEPAAKQQRLSGASTTSVTELPTRSSAGGSADESPAELPAGAADINAAIAADNVGIHAAVLDATARSAPEPCDVRSGIPAGLLTASTLCAIQDDNMLLMSNMALVTEINRNGSKKKICSLLKGLGASRACWNLSRVEASVVLFNVRGVVGAVENVDENTWRIASFTPSTCDYNMALFPTFFRLDDVLYDDLLSGAAQSAAAAEEPTDAPSPIDAAGFTAGGI